MKTYKLLPTDGRKSFGGKCKVVEYEECGETVATLYSYDRKVAEYNHDTNIMTVHGWYSVTTAKHINAFLNFFGFDTCTKQQLKNCTND